MSKIRVETKATKELVEEVMTNYRKYRDLAGIMNEVQELAKSYFGTFSTLPNTEDTFIDVTIEFKKYIDENNFRFNIEFGSEQKKLNAKDDFNLIYEEH